MAYAASAGALAVYTLCCYAGWLWPTAWATASWPQQRLLLEYRSGVPLRLAGASIDPNAAAMILLVAFGASLYLFDWRQSSQTRRFALVAVQGALAAAIGVAMSRSALLIAGVLLAVRVARAGVRRRYWVLAAAVAVVVAAALPIVAAALIQSLGHRIQGGFAHDDPSLRGRVQVYVIGLHLLHDHGLWGCGLGTIDTALAASRFAEQAVMTVHSMPLALWIELGVAGFIAWAWLWVAIARAGGSMLARTNDAETRRHGAMFLAMAAGVFGMTLVQPFATSPLYPFVLALGLGPRTAPTRTGPRASKASYRAAAVLCGAVVAWNAVQYANTARALERYSDLLAEGNADEMRTQWTAAMDAYRNAADIATRERFMERRALFDVAADVVDTSPLFASIGVLVDRPDPAAVAECALARVQLAVGDVDEATNTFASVWRADPRLADTRFDLAEACWRAGAYAKAIDAYEQAAAMQVAAPTRTDLLRLTKLESRMRELQGSALSVPDKRDLAYFSALLTDPDTGALSWPHARRMRALRARLDALRDSTVLEELLERAELQRRLGSWPECVSLCQQALERDPACAQALFVSGVAAQLEGRHNDARLRYEEAIRALPNHVDARVALRNLEVEGSPDRGAP
jgi:tetratricopeptide (TPR) repeat protein